MDMEEDRILIYFYLDCFILFVVCFSFILVWFGLGFFGVV